MNYSLGEETKNLIEEVLELANLGNDYEVISQDLRNISLAIKGKLYAIRIFNLDEKELTFFLYEFGENNSICLLYQGLYDIEKNEIVNYVD